jgi:hypothetical protein
MRPYLRMFLAAIWCVPSLLSAQQNLTQVRVVRLSYVVGTVAVKRPGSSEWAKAMVNTPIQEGFQLETSGGSFAEVQFENGSTASLGELSNLDFSQLAMDSNGNKLNRLSFRQGYATFHFIPERGDLYAVSAAGATLTPKGKSEFRTDFDRNQLRVEVFSGLLDVASPSRSSVQLGRDKVLEFQPETAAALNIQRGIEKDSWDKWTEARHTQSQLALGDQAVGLNRVLYGWEDLDEYGDWAYIPGFGYGWAPYAAAGWAPYSMGLWNWYPSLGWTWISGEPWGWLPYHSGLWNFDSNFGWFWMPGNLGSWSPALVSWWSGPGWIGWTPYGAVLPAGYTGVVTVPGGTVQNGTLIGPSGVVRRPLGQGIPIARPSFPPSALAMLSGVPLPKDVTLPGSAVSSQAVGGRRSLSAGPVAAAESRAQLTSAGIAATRASGGYKPSGVRLRSAAAPTTVLMDGDAATERAALQNHSGFWGRLLGTDSRQPLHARVGTTLGGHFPVAGVGSRNPEGLQSVREFAGNPAVSGGRQSAFSRMSGGGTAFVLPHGGASGLASGREGGSMAEGRSGPTGFSSGPTGFSSAPAGHSTGGASSGSSGGGGGHH